MWPKKNTAFVVIHGAGFHRPFVTLDKFARGFVDVLRSSNPDLDQWWQHKLLRHEDWVEHYVSLAPTGKPVLDFYEYYWDCYVDHEIDIPQVIEWLSQVSDSAKRFYSKQPDLAKEHQRQGSELFRDEDFKIGGYFAYFGWAGRILGALQRVGIARVPVLSTAVQLLLRRASRILADMMGDVVFYTAADIRSKSYAVRQRVLQGAVEELRLLLKMDKYDQVIVVGHSLGSVIAYDALNRIIVEMNTGSGISREQAQKIVGLVTFGSPLDKVAFFFREHSPDEEYIRRQLLAHLHGFKGRPFPGESDPISIDNPIRHRLDRTRWLNFYHLQDPVSGHLDAYEVDKNILCDAVAGSTGEAHSAYWTYDGMYQEIGAEFFKSTLDAFLSDVSA